MKYGSTVAQGRRSITFVDGGWENIRGFCFLCSVCTRVFVKNVHG